MPAVRNALTLMSDRTCCASGFHAHASHRPCRSQPLTWPTSRSPNPVGARL